MSRTKTFTRTRPPASRHKACCHFLQDQPRRPNTPVPHAARWWPRTSRGRPQWQVRADKGNGSPRRWRKKRRKDCGSNQNSFLEGMAVNAADAMGPACERRSAASVSVNWGRTMCLRKRVSTGSVDLFCHPFLGWPGSALSREGWVKELAQSSTAWMLGAGW